MAKTVGEERALVIYHKLLKITKSVTDPLTVNRQVWYSRYIDEADFWPSEDYTKYLQQGDGLGQRMKGAFRQTFADDFDKVVIIGSDCSGLSTSIIQQAFRLLEEQDVVVGPSQDGGYYLLGMRKFYPALFEQIKWSTSVVCEQTTDRLEKIGASYQLLPVLNDIDTAEDLDQSQRLS